MGKRRKDDNKLLLSIKELYRKNRGNYGSPRITDDLRDQGFCCGKNRVARIMKANGIAAKTKKKFKATTNSKHNLPVAENLLKQNFTSPRANAIWVSDVTYIWTNERGGRVCLDRGEKLLSDKLLLFILLPASEVA